MTGPSYPAARIVAARVQPHFARHLAAARGRQDLAPEPDAPAIEEIINTAFWASLRREESYVPKISLAFLPPNCAGSRPLTFERPLPLASDALARLAPAVERPGIHLGVWCAGGELHVWGTTRSLPMFCFVIEVIAPGLLVIKHSRGEESGKFVNVAVLEGADIKVLDQDAANLSKYPHFLASLLGFESPTYASDSISVIAQVAVSMRAHGRGGLLLVVPSASQIWRESIVQPIQYSVSPPFSEIPEILREDPDGKRQRRWQEALRRAVEALAGLTEVDGATVITDRYEVLAFGAKIGRRDGWPQVEHVIVTEPIEGSAAQVVHPGQLGGTRHLSSAQFAQDQRDAVALVASQDGRFTIFAWSPTEAMVHAHRVEALLL